MKETVRNILVYCEKSLLKGAGFLWIFLLYFDRVVINKGLCDKNGELR